MKRIQILFLTLLLASQLHSQNLERRASFEATISMQKENPGAVINAIDNNSPLNAIGLEIGDVIIKVDDRKIVNSTDWNAVLYAIRANKKTKLKIKRGQDLLNKTVELNPLPLEKHTNLDTYYESIVNDYGITQRVIITKPKGQTNLPAIILIQGLSCSTIEKYSERSSNWARQINHLVENSNMVVLRVEKPGVGDSEGDCGETDFLTELNGYENALKLLLNKKYINRSKVVVYGSSMGSAIAPYLANKYNLAGVISDGTFFKTWYEHMLEIERRILEIEGKSQSEILNLMNTVYIPLYYEMLIKKRSFEDILKDNPTYAQYHRQGANHMYGRPMVYYHQMQDFNFAKEWEELKTPIRIRWGTNDWIMTENDNDMIISILEKNNHKNHLLYKYNDLDHWSTLHPNYENSFYFKPGKWEDKISQQIIDWAWDMVEITK